MLDNDLYFCETKHLNQLFNTMVQNLYFKLHVYNINMFDIITNTLCI